MPVLMLLSSTATIEESLNDVSLSEMKRKELKKVLDFDEAREMFKSNELN